MSWQPATGLKTSQDWLPRQRPGFAASKLLARLRDKPYEFEFFQAVFLLQRFQEDVVDPGFLGPYTREAVWFSARTDLSVPASQIQEIRSDNKPVEPGEEIPPQMVVNFIGLQGPLGALPNHYTQLIQQLERLKENPERGSLKALLDLFNHRLTSLFYRTSIKYCQSSAMMVGAVNRRGGFDPFTEALFCIAGLGQLVVRNQVGGRSGAYATDPAAGSASGPVSGQHPGASVLFPFEDRFLLRHGSSLGRLVRTAHGLESLLSEYLGIPARVEQFRPRWLALEPDCQTALEAPSPDAQRNPETGHLYGGLGTGAICGTRVLEIQSHFRVRIGPVDSATYNQFLMTKRPGDLVVPASLLLIVRDLVRLFVRGGLDFDIQLELKGEAVPPPVLGPVAPILGQSLWLYQKKPAHLVGDVVFQSGLFT